jgi:hypothetical protein
MKNQGNNLTLWYPYNHSFAKSILNAPFFRLPTGLNKEQAAQVSDTTMLLRITTAG